MSRLVNVRYLNCDMLQHADPVTLKKLCGSATKVRKKIKPVISEMFTTEINSLLIVLWYGSIKSTNLKMFWTEPQSKKCLWENHLMDWENGKYCICNFPLQVNAKGVDKMKTKWKNLPA